MSKKIGIIGAGPAGITTGYELAKAGFEVHVYEASDSVGGMAKSFKLWDQIVDVGPHRFFSSDTRVNEAWLEVVGRDYDMVDRLTRIYYKKKFFNYPLNASNALKNLGIFESARCMMSFFWAKIFKTKDESSFEGWVSNRFGKRLFQIFFKTYSEKLWGISCKELDADFAAQRIKKLSLWEAVVNAFFKSKKVKHKTLVDQFAYPLEGTGMVYKRMEAFINASSGKVILNTPVKRVVNDGLNAKAIELVSGEVIEYDHIVSSMPLTLVVKQLSDVPENIQQYNARLNYRNTILVYLNIDDKKLFPDNWLYIHSPGLDFGRVTNFRNWVPQINGNSQTTILAMEYWCYESDDIWNKSNDAIIDQAKKEIRATGLIGDANIIDGFVYKINRSYPVYDKGYKERLLPVEQYLSTLRNISFVGRYGAFKYNNQDHSILMGLLAAENIKEGKTVHNLWEINTDYDSYQESSVITKTGLEKNS